MNCNLVLALATRRIQNLVQCNEEQDSEIRRLAIDEINAHQQQIGDLGFFEKDDFSLDEDPLFASFLQAGAARVQVPVRPGFEERIVTYASTGRLWTAEGSLVNGSEGGEEGDGQDLHLSVLDELKSQTGNNNVEGVGTVSVTQGSSAVTGAGTSFTGNDRRRRISIGGATYVIKSVTDATHLTLTTPYDGATEVDLGYSLGGTLIGEPWEVKQPTNLVKLDSAVTIT
jgi:hypothetical protein